MKNEFDLTEEQIAKMSNRRLVNTLIDRAKTDGEEGNADDGPDTELLKAEIMRRLNVDLEMRSTLAGN